MITNLPQIAFSYQNQSHSPLKINLQSMHRDKNIYHQPLQQSIKTYIDNIRVKTNTSQNKNIIISDLNLAFASTKTYSKKLKQLRLDLFKKNKNQHQDSSLHQQCKIVENKKLNPIDKKNYQLLKINQLSNFRFAMIESKKATSNASQRQKAVKQKNQRLNVQKSSRFSLRQIKQQHKRTNHRYLIDDSQKDQNQQNNIKNKSQNQLFKLLKRFQNKNSFKYRHQTQSSEKGNQQNCYYKKDKSKNKIDHCKQNKESYQKIKKLIIKKQRCRTSLEENQQQILFIQQAKLQKQVEHNFIQQQYKQLENLQKNYSKKQLNGLRKITKLYIKSQNKAYRLKKQNERVLRDGQAIQKCVNCAQSASKYKTARYSDIPVYQFLYQDDAIQENEQQEQTNVRKTNKNLIQIWQGQNENYRKLSTYNQNISQKKTRTKQIDQDPRHLTKYLNEGFFTSIFPSKLLIA